MIRSLGLLSLWVLVGSALFFEVSCNRNFSALPVTPNGNTPSPSATSSPVLTMTPTISSTSTPLVSSTNTPIMTYTASFTCTTTPVYTGTPTVTSTQTATFSSTPTITATPQATATPSGTWFTGTPTRTGTPTNTSTPTETVTPTSTAFITPTATATPSGTWYTATATGTPTLTPTYTITSTPTTTGTPTITWTPTNTFTPNATATACTSLSFGNNQAPDGAVSSSYHALYVCRYQATFDMTLYTMSGNFWMANGISNPQYQFAVYSDNGSGGMPVNLLGQTSAQNLTIDGWNTAPLITPVFISAGSYYWLAFMVTTGETIQCNSGSPSPVWLLNTTYVNFDAFPATLAPQTPTTGVQFCIYASGCPAIPVTYTPTVLPTPTPSTTPTLIPTATATSSSATATPTCTPTPTAT